DHLWLSLPTQTGYALYVTDGVAPLTQAASLPRAAGEAIGSTAVEVAATGAIGWSVVSRVGAPLVFAEQGLVLDPSGAVLARFPDDVVDADGLAGPIHVAGDVALVNTYDLDTPSPTYATTMVDLITGELHDRTVAGFVLSAD